MKIYIARDGRGLFLFLAKPQLHGGMFLSRDYDGWTRKMSDELFPEIKNGDCYSAEIKLGEKV